MIHRQADRMAKLISQLLHMTRMEQGTEGAEMKPLDLAAETAALLGEQFPAEPRLTVRAEDKVTVHADRDLLARLLRNLVENALKYSPADAPVTVAVTRTETEACLSVTDQGIGIPAEDRERIWTRFYRADPSRTDSDSTGLGLAIVQSIARLLGGRMTLQTEVGQGSTFTLHLPLGE